MSGNPEPGGGPPPSGVEEQTTMQILVLYHSKGGNTKKLAQAVAKGVDSVGGASALLKSAIDISRADLKVQGFCRDSIRIW
jgi:flavodoxin